jgi:arginase family enzyme
VEVLGLLKRKSRAHIKAADKNLAVVDISAEEFADFYAENLRDAGVASYSPLHVARDLIAEGISRKQVRVIAAKKRIVGSLDNRSFDAAIACAWDEDARAGFGWVESVFPGMFG